MESSTHCPRCDSTHLMHTWRTDMARLHWLDEWKCLACGERWQFRTTPLPAPVS